MHSQDMMRDAQHRAVNYFCNNFRNLEFTATGVHIDLHDACEDWKSADQRQQLLLRSSWSTHIEETSNIFAMIMGYYPIICKFKDSDKHEEFRFLEDQFYELKEVWVDQMSQAFDATCNKCGGSMGLGKAMVPTPKYGVDDFPGQRDKRGQTFTMKGAAYLADCLKCKECGHSIQFETEGKQNDG